MNNLRTSRTADAKELILIKVLLVAANIPFLNEDSLIAYRNKFVFKLKNRLTKKLTTIEFFDSANDCSFNALDRLVDMFEKADIANSYREDFRGYRLELQGLEGEMLKETAKAYFNTQLAIYDQLVCLFGSEDSLTNWYLELNDL